MDRGWHAGIMLNAVDQAFIDMVSLRDGSETLYRSRVLVLFSAVVVCNGVALLHS